MEAILKQFMELMDQRFDQMDDRFDKVENDIRSLTEEVRNYQIENRNHFKHLGIPNGTTPTNVSIGCGRNQKC